ncbi:MAG: helix-turn-helix transcriptional regulator [bacterium]
MRVAVKPEMLRWACERAGFDAAEMAERIPQLPAWERGESQPTLKQVEGFAKATHTPVGYLFLDTPPVEHVPIPDFRTMAGGHVESPSPDLLDSIYLCQQRQEWYREFVRSTGETPLSFVGSVNLTSDVVATAAAIRHALGFDLEERREMPTESDHGK